jgi:hypothetical protein
MSVVCEQAARELGLVVSGAVNTSVGITPPEANGPGVICVWIGSAVTRVFVPDDGSGPIQLPGTSVSCA